MKARTRKQSEMAASDKALSAQEVLDVVVTQRFEEFDAVNGFDPGHVRWLAETLARKNGGKIVDQLAQAGYLLGVAVGRRIGGGR